MNPPDDKDDLLAIPDFLRRTPKPAQPAAPAPIATTRYERIWIMPKTAKAKPAKSQKTDPAVVAAKKATKAAKKQRGAERKAKTTSKPAANIQEYIARGKHRGLAIVPADGAAGAPERKTRDGTKQAKMIEMLRRPEGATIAQIVAETDWQKHTVRGAISGALKKKLGLTVTSEKVDGGDRIYRIAGE